MITKNERVLKAVEDLKSILAECLRAHPGDIDVVFWDWSEYDHVGFRIAEITVENPTNSTSVRAWGSWGQYDYVNKTDTPFTLVYMCERYVIDSAMDGGDAQDSAAFWEDSIRDYLG